MRAINIVHWPGKDTLACADHTQQLRGLANMLIGFLSVTPLPSESEVECENCANSKPKSTGALGDTEIGGDE